MPGSTTVKSPLLCLLVVLVGSAWSQEPCTLCPTGDDPSDLGRPIDIPGGPFPDTCQELAVWAAAIPDAKTAECDFMRLLAVYCGCPTTANSCSFCPTVDQDADNGSPIATTLSNRDQLLETDDEFRFDLLVPLLGFSPNCAHMESITAQSAAGTEDCQLSSFLATECNCTIPAPPTPRYGGARNTRQERVLFVLPKISAVFSLIGSLLIIRDIVYKVQKYETYQIIMLAISVFDIIGCLSWALSQHAVPDGVKEGGVGNMNTCRTAGFMTQLSFTATFYNAILCLYYYLTINWGFRERDFKKLRLVAYSLPPAIGLALAAAGWNKYSQLSVWGCYFSVPPIADDFRNIIIFAVVPIATAISICTVFMVLVCWHVRQKVLQSLRWSARQYSAPQSANTSSSNDIGYSSSDGTLSRQAPAPAVPRTDHDVFWQAVFYLGALYVCWPILLYSFSITHWDEKYYAFHVVFFICSPLQGFLNAMVYFRPRVVKSLRAGRRQQRQRTHSRRQTPTTSKTNASVSRDEVLSSEGPLPVEETPAEAPIDTPDECDD